MRAQSICHSLLSSSLRRVHKKRVAAVWTAVSSLLTGGVLALTGLGRHCAGTGKEKHYIKKMDRLLSNAHLSFERSYFYGALTTVLMRPSARPVIAIDWTPWCEGFHAITAGLCVGGRCVIIYGEVHAEKRLNNPKVHRRFLDALERLLPADCVPVLTTDGGFRTSWIDAVEEKQWDYVARVRGRVHYFDDERQQWLPINELFSLARTKARSLGDITLTESKPRRRRVVVVRQRQRRRSRKAVGGRVRRHKTPGAEKRAGHSNNTSTADNYYRTMSKEPWVLVTSMKQAAARTIAASYNTRMQTEESYRGLKSHYYGWSFEDSRSTTCQRLNVLLMIGALASFVTILIGWIAEKRDLHRGYQANTIKTRRVLSWFFLGIRVIERGIHLPTRDQLEEAMRELSINCGVEAIAEKGRRF